MASSIGSRPVRKTPVRHYINLVTTACPANLVTRLPPPGGVPDDVTPKKAKKKRSLRDPNIRQGVPRGHSPTLTIGGTPSGTVSSLCGLQLLQASKFTQMYDPTRAILSRAASLILYPGMAHMHWQLRCGAPPAESHPEPPESAHTHTHKTNPTTRANKRDPIMSYSTWATVEAQERTRAQLASSSTRQERGQTTTSRGRYGRVARPRVGVLYLSTYAVGTYVRR